MREADRRTRQAEKGFRALQGSLPAVDAKMLLVDDRLAVFHSWAREEADEQHQTEIAVELNRVSDMRMLLDQWSREPSAVAVGSRLEQRWRRNGTGSD